MSLVGCLSVPNSFNQFTFLMHKLDQSSNEEIVVELVLDDMTSEDL